MFRCLFADTSIFGKVKDKTGAEYPYNMPYNIMINVIGDSYSAELIVKGAYENTIGRLTEWIAGIKEPLTEERKVEGFMQYVAQDYTDFILYNPWYNYPFWTRLKEFWHVKDGAGTSFIRRWERRGAFTLEMLFKAAYGKAIGFGTRNSYEKPQLNTYAMVNENGYVVYTLDTALSRFHGGNPQTGERGHRVYRYRREHDDPAYGDRARSMESA